MAKVVYLKLGNKDASVFSCALTGVKVTRNVPGKVAKVQIRRNSKIELALRHGHLKAIEEAEYTKMLEAHNKNLTKAAEVSKAALEAKDEVSLENTDTSIVSSLGSMTKHDLLTYYKDNYEVSPSDETKFAKLNKAEMVEYLTSLEEDDEE